LHRPCIVNKKLTDGGSESQSLLLGKVPLPANMVKIR
jgi:hypothetical protein